ncbi:MAG: 16S rRNA (guanine(527)-N(7))-methyltransferase RsmG [Cardiobacteriaceae bacterium]|nr:16S rRNA (guanine(527)-N(7))-methyltransferase RsmG [Cardiobacteriaceae bacterium]
MSRLDNSEDFQDKHREILVQGCAQFNFTLPANFTEKTEKFLKLLNHWNKIHNLTAIRNCEEQIYLHIFDCLAALPYAENSLLNNPTVSEQISVADIGSGAGFPGLVWAIAKPNWKIFTVESAHKKASFLQEAKRHLELANTTVIAHRVEDWKIEENIDLIVARAVANADKFLEQAGHLINHNNCLGMMKARSEEKITNPAFQKINCEKISVPKLDAERIWIEIRRSTKN